MCNAEQKTEEVEAAKAKGDGAKAPQELASNAAKQSSTAPPEHAQRPNPLAQRRDRQQMPSEKQQPYASLATSLFQFESPSEMGEKGAARQPPQAAVGADEQQTCPSAQAAERSDDEAPDVDNVAPDWLATQAATQFVPLMTVAESQPFPFDFAALVPDRPKRGSAPDSATPTPTIKGDAVGKAAPAEPSRCFTNLFVVCHELLLCTAILVFYCGC